MRWEREVENNILKISCIDGRKQIHKKKKTYFDILSCENKLKISNNIYIEKIKDNHFK